MTLSRMPTSISALQTLGDEIVYGHRRSISTYQSDRVVQTPGTTVAFALEARLDKEKTLQELNPLLSNVDGLRLLNGVTCFLVDEFLLSDEENLYLFPEDVLVESSRFGILLPFLMTELEFALDSASNSEIPVSGNGTGLIQNRLFFWAAQPEEIDAFKDAVMVSINDFIRTGFQVSMMAGKERARLITGSCFYSPLFLPQPLLSAVKAAATHDVEEVSLEAEQEWVSQGWMP